MNYRLYSFVANHYLSPLQCGLQTAHVVSELSTQKDDRDLNASYEWWANRDKTIIICGAGNHAGVVAAYERLKNLTTCTDQFMPVAIFREDEQSMNGMATACGIIVPDVYYGAEVDEDGWCTFRPADGGASTLWSADTPESAFITYLKSFRLA